MLRRNKRHTTIASILRSGRESFPPDWPTARILEMRAEGQSLRQIAENLGIRYGRIRERLTDSERKTPYKTEREKPPIKDT